MRLIVALLFTLSCGGNSPWQQLPHRVAVSVSPTFGGSHDVVATSARQSLSHFADVSENSEDGATVISIQPANATCTPTQTGYVLPTEPHTVYLCRRAFELGQRTLRVTIAHEIAHTAGFARHLDCTSAGEVLAASTECWIDAHATTDSPEDYTEIDAAAFHADGLTFH